MWHKKLSSCKNCGTTNHPHKVRGFCKKCYPIILRIEKARKWDFNVPETLKDLPVKEYFVNDKNFVKIKNGIITQLEERLNWFRVREDRLKNKIYGIDIEYGLSRIAYLSGVKDKSLFHGYANIFEHNFSMDQKKIIFKMIDKIEQNLTWKGIDLYRIFFDS